jgi:hypothetical protein
MLLEALNVPNIAFNADDSEEEGQGNGGFFEGLCTAHEPRESDLIFTKEAGIFWYTPAIQGNFLAFDIETTGFSDADHVTCVCAYNPERSVKFSRCLQRGEVCEPFLKLLDEAPVLSAFNGVKFDIPFLVKRWAIPEWRAHMWTVKLVDPFQTCKLVLGQTFSLDRLLHSNGIETKTSSGAEAVLMAKEGRWEELADYCMQDTMKTHQVLSLKKIKIPYNHVLI